MIGFSFDIFGQTTIISNHISGNYILPNSTIWSNSVYYIKDDIVIPNNRTLTISQGVLLVFYKDYTSGNDDKGHALTTGIFIEGSLIINGSSTMLTTLKANNTSLGWEGLNWGATNTGTNNANHSSIKYSIIENVTKTTLGNCPANSKTSGAIYLNNFNNINIENCKIRNNYVSFIGGGISISEENCTQSLLQNYPIIKNNNIYNNYAKRGGGVAILHAEHQTPYIFNNNIFNNIAEFDGGGIAVLKKSQCEISNNKIYDNIAECKGISTPPEITGGGAIVVGFQSDADLFDNSIYSNQALFNINASDITGQGGGILIRLSSNAVLFNNNIYSNSSNDGGAIAIYGTKPSLYTSVFLTSKLIAKENYIHDNYAVQNGAGILINRSGAEFIFNAIYSNNASNGKGGGVYIFASTINASSNNSIIKIYHNTIRNNIANKAAGIFADGISNTQTIFCTYIDLINNLIYSNNSNLDGAGIYLGEGFININCNNNTIVKNISNYNPLGNALFIPIRNDKSIFSFVNNILYFNGDPYDCQIYYPESVKGEFSFNDIMLLGCQIDPFNNFDTPPDFIDLINNNFHLTPSSPIIDLGNNTVFPITAEDIDHAPRFNNQIDIGASEYNSGYPRLFKHPIKSVLLLPNPAKSTVKIESINIIKSISIYSIEGKLVFFKTGIDNTHFEVNISKFSKGIYQIIVNHNSDIDNLKLIKF